MKLITWNVRGANGRKKLREIRNLRCKLQAVMIFIQETKIRVLDEKLMQDLWGEDKMLWFGANSEGSSGGLVSVWDPDFFQPTRKVKGKSFVLISGNMKINQQEVRLNFLNVYAPTVEREKLKLWEALVDLKSSKWGEWVIGGDFNSVLVEEEKSRSVFNEKDANAFQDFIQAMGVLDLPLKGRCFTWGNRKGASRLDRFLISPGVLSRCPNLLQMGLGKGSSDHAAVSLGEVQKSWGRRPFRVLNVWLNHPAMKGKVKDVWLGSEDLGWKGISLQRKLGRVRSMMALWNKKSFGDVSLKLGRAREEWERLSLVQDDRNLSEEEALRKLALQKIIWMLEVQDERIWRQKSRISWLRLGDHNTKFFHRMATWRSRRNCITSLLVDGEWIDDPVKIKHAAWNYFSMIFRRGASCDWSLKDLFSGSLSEVQRSLLESEISEEEILAAVKDSDGNKAPGPDGFNVYFYKRFWPIVGGEVVAFIKEFCSNGRLASGINKTFIALIPKTVNPQSFEDFRPISLVNSMYKILSKCLVKRLKSVLPQFISLNQSAFISDRNILDGIMIVNELIHVVKRERRSALVIKLDFRKAYDSVSWEFLRAIQESLGFGDKWILWMHECYSSASLSILVNGSPSKVLPMERGLRQGDPLSPFLFLLVAEGLSRLLNNAVRAGMIKGVGWGKNGEALTHLQLADDTVLFCRPVLEEVQNLKHILRTFAVSSGLEINFHKSRCVGVGLEEGEVEKFDVELGCPRGEFLMKYLGMQVGANPGRLNTWSPILEKFKLKLATWRCANLSMAGRVVLIKSALCNLPLYYASMYKMPVAVANELEKIQRRFLWGSSDLKRKIHYVRWSKITKPKKFGGLGIQIMVDMNLVLLAKWWWRSISGKGGLWRRMVLEKYAIKRYLHPREEMDASNKLSSSWKDILKIVRGNSEVALALKEGLKLKLGDGCKTSFWHDTWLGDEALKIRYPKLYQLLSLNSLATVGEMDFWEGGFWSWQLRFRRPLYQWEETSRRELESGLSHIQLKSHVDDRMVGTYSSDGLFSSNSLMKAALAIRSNKKKWENLPFQLWSGLAPPKVEMFIWRVFLDGLPSKVALQRRRILRREEDLVCVLCNSEQETADHLLLHCRWSWNLWALCLSWWGSCSWVMPKSSRSLLESWTVEGVSRSHKRLWKTFGYAIMWTIWEERNLRCFQNKIRSAGEISELVKVRLAWWAKFRGKKSPYSVLTISRCIEEVKDSF
ncbi:unnamed protein product [Rhodiola kirilowii]